MSAPAGVVVGGGSVVVGAGWVVVGGGSVVVGAGCVVVGAGGVVVGGGSTVVVVEPLPSMVYTLTWYGFAAVPSESLKLPASESVNVLPCSEFAGSYWPAES